MRKINISSLIVGGILVAGTNTACQNQVSDLPIQEEPATLLEVEVVGIDNDTRGIIESDMLPDNTEYGIFAMEGANNFCIDGGYNVQVKYSGYKSTLVSNVVLPADFDVPVFAYYPYRAVDFSEMPVEAVSQTDYLWGYSNVPVNREQPKAGITFEHIMSRITLRFHREADNDETYRINSIKLGGDREGQYRVGWVNLIHREFIAKDYSQYEMIEGSMSGNYLDDNNRQILADFLVIPSETQWDLNIEFDKGSQWFFNMPSNDFKSGQQYIYDVYIHEDRVLLFILAEIRHWNNNEMPEVELQ